MCGIAGFISIAPLCVKIIQDMTDIISYRGPDDEGFLAFKAFGSTPLIASGSATPNTQEKWPPYFPKHSIEDLGDAEAQIAFGHRRLSIVDPSPQGHQPMSYMSGRYWITYNGEIYNYLEIREELKTCGYTFETHTDTEVILAAYDRWGEGCLNHFNGMWAFAIYDIDTKKVFLARDRFGVKPLYYLTLPEGSFFFGSEIKQFTCLPQWSASLNIQRAYDFLAWGLIDHTEETLFNNVLHLKPGHSITIDVGSIRNSIDAIKHRQWYQLKSRQDKNPHSPEILKKLLTDSVRLRLRADVPVGSCLSGGIDSSSIVCLMGDILKDAESVGMQKTFSACSNVSAFDERKWMDKVADGKKIDAHYTYPSFDDVLEDSKKIIWHQDEPYGSTSIYAQWKVFELASKNNVRVMLDGQGADEQLAGYHTFFGAYLAGLISKMKWRDALHEAKSIKSLYGYSWVNLFGRTLYAAFPEFLSNAVLKLAKKDGAKPSWINFETLPAQTKRPFPSISNTVDGLCHAQILSTNLPMLLHWEDRDSMAHSIESRVPFLDYRLVEFSMGLPDNMKIKNGITKKILRDAMRGIIPDEICNRTDKIGFATPEQFWLKGEGRQDFREALEKSIESSQGILNRSALILYDDIVDGKKPFSHAIWRMICFGQWMDIFSVQISSRS